MAHPPCRCLVAPAALLLCLSGVGCASLRSPVAGLLYTDVQAARAATSSQAGSRVGEACAKTILGLVAIGDASIEAARRNGAVSMITSVDERYESYGGFIYGVHCTIVRGR